MTETMLIAATLGLSAPWKITDVTFSDSEKRVDITIEFSHDTPCACPRCGAPARISEVETQRWLRTDFFRYDAHLHVRVPSIACTKECGCLRAALPWSQENPRFISVF